MLQIGCLLQNLLSAQHVSGNIMPIIRSSRIVQMVAACGAWVFGLPVVGLVWSSTPDQRPATICTILELQMVGMLLAETC
jgi:hypothetical protein